MPRIHAILAAGEALIPGLAHARFVWDHNDGLSEHPEPWAMPQRHHSERVKVGASMDKYVHAFLEVRDTVMILS